MYDLHDTINDTHVSKHTKYTFNRNIMSQYDFQCLECCVFSSGCGQYPTGTVSSSPISDKESLISPNSENIFYSSGIRSHNTDDNPNRNGQLATAKPITVSISVWYLILICDESMTLMNFGKYFTSRTEVGQINGDQVDHVKIFHCTYQQQKHHDEVVASAVES